MTRLASTSGLLLAAACALIAPVASAADKPSPDEIARIIERLTTARGGLYTRNAVVTSNFEVFNEAAQSKVDYARSRSAKLLDENYIVEDADTAPGSKRGADLYAINSRYYFELTRPAGKTDWVLRKMAPLEEGFELRKVSSLTGSDFRTALVDELIDPWSIPTFGSTRYALADLTRAPGFEPVAALESTDRVVLTFDLLPTSVAKVPARYEAEFDLAAFAIPIRIEIAIQVPAENISLTKKLRRTVTVTGPKAVRVQAETIIRGTGKAEQHTRAVADHQIAFGKAREEDFRLTAYGLPEPVDVVWPRTTPTYVWLLVGAGAAAGLAGLAAALRRRSARSERTQ